MVSTFGEIIRDALGEGLLADAGNVIVGVVLALLFYQSLGFALHTEEPIVTVVSYSMYPTLDRGNMLVLEGIPASEIRKSDIIVYNQPSKGKLIVHRVWSINPDGTFKTKGDNMDTNALPDPWDVKPEWIKGRVIAKFPYLGYPRLMLGDIVGAE